MKIQTIFPLALSLAMLAAAIGPVVAANNNADDGGAKKFFRDSCAQAMTSHKMPMSVMPMPWCMDMKTGKMTPFFMMMPSNVAG